MLSLNKAANTSISASTTAISSKVFYIPVIINQCVKTMIVSYEPLPESLHAGSPHELCTPNTQLDHPFFTILDINLLQTPSNKSTGQ